ncbi:hypothetical protein HanIR_Chr11g0516471 [Helianthus annuus]|nr:hypothetical protein HanIR_Chr11g0516471 [Helianthus annuus]
MLRLLLLLTNTRLGTRRSRQTYAPTISNEMEYTPQTLSIGRCYMMDELLWNQNKLGSCSR